MKYEDMRFTDNDKKKLRENKKMIVDWIMENIVPNMAKDSKIKCDFGEIYKCPITSSTVKTYHFYVYSELNEFYSGGGVTTKGFIGYGQKFAYMSESFENVYSPYDIYPIVDNWASIKRELLNGIKEQKVIKKEIYEFEV